MAATRITSVSDPTKHASLLATWNFESQPEWFSTTMLAYRAIRMADGTIEFDEYADKADWMAFMKSSSVSHMRP